ncbi:MAG: hypothetical protein L0170_08320 [Acidobacteria bacterium]|nr:hypothetical protein [Acidobacteriota bacterium]
MRRSDRSCPQWLLWCAVCALAAFVCLILFDAVFARVEKDEGFYDYAFRLVAGGELPYRDFSYIESPALPYYYAWLLAWPGITLHSVRFLSALTGLAGLLVLTRCAWVAGGRMAAALTALLLFANPYHAEFFARDVTYPLITLLLALALRLELSSASPGLRTAGQAFLLALAGAAKASMGVVALVWLALLLWRRRRDRRAVLLGAGAFLAGLLVSVGPLFLAAPAAFWFNVVTASLHRGSLFPFMRLADPLDQWLEFGWGQKILGARTVILWHLPLVVLSVLCLTRRSPRMQPRDGVLGESTLPVAAALVGGLLFHLLVPSPAYPNYCFLILPTLGVLVTLSYARMIGSGEPQPPKQWWLALPVILGALNLLAGFDPNEVGLEVGTWRNGPQRELARLVGQIVPPQGRLLTDYLPVAVDANRLVVRGNEGGRASLIPDLPDDEARAFHFLNRKLYLDVLSQREVQGVVLTQQLTEQSFNTVPGFLEEIEMALSRNYELVREFPPSVYFDYGRIRVFRLRNLEAAAASAGRDPTASPPGNASP